ncbi:MAG: nucleotidyltransferase domain-containing protein [Theionarchaea archaeon]|nr:MAG: hypothetical protein AYK19_10810 [Theionarchaea archaeon DG-70-1]MBU7026668.1 nucleotidyltransferase domain-containing protein [Theionarchaea archaeon]
MDVLNEVTEQCRKALGKNLVSVVLFGSTARGLQDSRSDIDVLIVVEEEVDNNFFKDIWIDLLMNYGVKLDTIVMAKKDVVDNFNYFSPLFLSFALGITILFDEGFFEKEYFKFLGRLKEENIKYVEGGKVWDLQKISSEILQ